MYKLWFVKGFESQHPSKLQMPSLFTLAFLFVSFLFVRCLWGRKATARLPPGPRPLPLLGNIHQLPKEHPQMAFAEWGKKYGGLVHAKIFGTSMLIINSINVARDLMDKRSSIYSGRPRFAFVAEMLGWENGIVVTDYNDNWRKQRRWMVEAFSKTALTNIRPILRRESCKALSSIMNSPQSWKEHIARYTGSAVLEIAYGHQATPEDGDFFEMSEKATVMTAEAGSAGGMLVDFFPLLKYYPLWLPGSGFKANALKVRSFVRKVVEIPFNNVKKQMAMGTAKPSLTTNLLEEAYRKGTLDEDEGDIRDAAAGLYGAGTETTNATMTTFILAMVIHQDVFKKVQEEIDRVVGQDRLPDVQDKDSLPYFKCVFLEVLRYLSPVPLGIPHKASKEDLYQGYLIPKDSFILGNIWAMAHDEETYSQPELFLPERFLEMDQSDGTILDPRTFTFGFGRRICPGKELAEESIFILISRIIATMNISRAKDAKGRDIVPSFDITSGLSCHPKPFDCVITPRSPRAIRLISEAALSN